MKIFKRRYKKYYETYLNVYNVKFDNESVGMVIKSTAPRGSRDDWICDIVSDVGFKHKYNKKNIILKSSRYLKLFVNNNYIIYCYKCADISRCVFLHIENGKIYFHGIKDTIIKGDTIWYGEEFQDNFFDNFREVKIIMFKNKDM